MSIARHTAYNLAGSLLPAAVTIVTVPVYLKVIGLERYGLLAVFWLLIGYFSLFDLGIGRAATQRIAALEQASADERNRIFWTALSLSATLSVVAAALFVPLGWIGLNLLKVQRATLGIEIAEVYPLLIAAVPIPFLQSLLSGTLIGRRRFFEVNLISTAGSLLTGLLPLASAIWLGPQLSHLFTAVVIARLLVLVLISGSVARAVPLSRPRLAPLAEVRAMLHFGGWLTVSNIIGPLMVFLDRFTIGVIISATAVAIYTIPFNLVSQLWVLPTALGTALFPRLSGAESSKAMKMAALALAALASLMLPLTAFLLIVMEPGLHLWLGSDIGNRSFPIGVILLLGFWINSLAQVPFIQLQSARRTDIIAKIHMAEVVPYFACLFGFLHWFGVVGAAIAWSLRVFIDFAAMAWAGKVPSRLIFRIAGQFALLIVIASAVLAGPIEARVFAAILAVGSVGISLQMFPTELSDKLRAGSIQILRNAGL